MTSVPPVIRIVLADDHAIVLEGLKMLLSMLDGVEVVGTVMGGIPLKALLRTTPADLLVLDLGLPDVDAMPHLREIRASYPGLRILVLTGNTDARMAEAALAAGADGYLVKSGSIDEVVPAVQALRQGERYVDSQFRLPGASRERVDAPGIGAAAGEVLTRREQQILALIARGATASGIAAELDISPLTARKHRENLMRKLDLHNTAALVAYAARMGIRVG